MKNKFLSFSLGISVLLMAGGFFIRSMQTANAKEIIPTVIQNPGAPGGGKYQMALATMVFNDGSTGSRIIVWDNETGKSIYYANNGNGWEKSPSQLPVNPFGN